MSRKFSMLSFVFSFTIVFAVASTNSYGEHAIVEIKDLVKDAADAVWSDGNGNAIEFDQTPGFYGGALRGSKLGGANGSFYSRTKELLIDESIQSETIDINFAATLGRNDSLVRGSYTLSLPNLKRIQLEVVYDLFLDNEDVRSPGEFHMEVHERYASEDNRWVKMGELHQDETTKAKYGQERINQIHNSRFVTHQFVVNLSKWAGKEVRLDLVANVPAHAVTPQKGRWCYARLVGSTFTWHFGLPEQVKIGNRSFPESSKTSKPARASEKISFTTTPALVETIPLTGIKNPEASLTTVNIDGRWFGYFHGLADGTSDDRGTMAFDLRNFSAEDLCFIDVSELQQTPLRGTTVGNATPGSSGTPFRILKPNYSDKSKWDAGYVGMTSALKENSGGDDYVHGFCHVEDWYQNGVDLNEYGTPNGTRDYWYVRIGYARSEADHGYDLSLMPYDDDTYATPVVESFQPEWAYTYSYPAPKTFGTAMPTVIKNGDYFYMFHTRFLDSSPDINYATGLGFSSPTDYRNKITSLIGGFHDQICVATAPVSLVIASDYEDEANPWRKGFYNQTTEEWEWKPARVPSGATESASYSYPIIHETDNTQYRGSPKVFYDTYFDQYMMICKGNMGFHIYLTNDDDLMDWNIDDIVLHYQGDNELILDPSLIGITGDDKYGQQMYHLYYTYDPDGIPGDHYFKRFWVQFDN